MSFHSKGFNKEDIDSKFAKYLPEEETLQKSQEVEQLSNRMSQLTHVSIFLMLFYFAKNILFQKKTKEIRDFAWHLIH